MGSSWPHYTIERFSPSWFLTLEVVRGILIDDLRVSVDVLHAGHQAAVVRDLPLLQKDFLNDAHEIH